MALNSVSTIDDRVRIQNVIVSVYDKDGLEVLVEGLLRANPDCLDSRPSSRRGPALI
jgi:hypothetical protein